MIEIKDENRKLLHIVYRLFDLKVTKRHEVIDANNFLQLAALNMPKGKTFEPHKHIWKEGEKERQGQNATIGIFSGSGRAAGRCRIG